MTGVNLSKLPSTDTGLHTPTGRIKSRVALYISCSFMIILCLGSTACHRDTGSGTKPALVDQSISPLTHDASPVDAENTSGWLTAGADENQSYFSPLDTINKANVHRVGFAWQYEIDSSRGFEATPIVVDGVLFASGPTGTVYAVDAQTGQERWSFDPHIDEDFVRRACCGIVNRGVAVSRGVVYVGSLDGYLYALDATTGDEVWKVDTFIDRDRGYTITGAPYIAKNVVVIGNSGAEYDARGYVTAYDISSGQERWRFFTVPGDPQNGFEHPEMAMAAKTWDPNSLWEVGLGGTAWDGMAFDPELNLLYVGTGNGTPHPQTLRSPAGGDNLFLSSILAINPDSGRLVWHYQTTPGDSWDFTATQKMILAELELQGKTRKVVMQAPKNGFFYVLDRTTGELLSADPYTEVTWASGIDKASGKPVITAQSDYSDEPKLIYPGQAGGHNWHPMAFNLKTGLVYIPTIKLPAVFAMPQDPFVYKKGGLNASIGGALAAPDIWAASTEIVKHLPSLESLAAGQPAITVQGNLKAWDPVARKVAWQVETSGQWLGKFYAAFNGGGVMTTAAGLVFQGRGSGELVAMDADTGKVLQSITVGTSLSAAPMTYIAGGDQYIAILAGTNGNYFPPGSASYRYGNQGRIVAFKLDGGRVPLRPELQRDSTNKTAPAVARTGTQQEIEMGASLFGRQCSQCHRNVDGSGIPNLRQMNAATYAEFFNIVLKGSRAEKGMGNFSSLLSLAEAETIYAYLVNEAWELYEENQQPQDLHQHR